MPRALHGRPGRASLTAVGIGRLEHRERRSVRVEVPRTATRQTMSVAARAGLIVQPADFAELESLDL
jgi:hypothetical protein